MSSKCATPTLCGSDGETCAKPGCDFFRAEQLDRAVDRRNRGISEYQRRMRAALRVIDANGLTAAYLLAYREEPQP